MIKHISLFIVLAAVSIQIMAQKKITQTAGRSQLGEFAPEFAHLNDDILFGEVWSRNDLLSLRDRSLVTITSLISQGITDSSLKYHLQSAKNNGITRTEAAEIITHIAFYAGWPKAWAAFNLAKEVWSEDVKGEDAKAAFQREMIFPIGEPNTAYAKYFIGNSYLAKISDSQIISPMLPLSLVAAITGTYTTPLRAADRCLWAWQVAAGIKKKGNQRRKYCQVP